MSRLPPGPKDWLLGFGNVYRLRKDPLRFVLDLGRTYGDIARFRVPLPLFYIWLVNHPDLIREVLVAKGKSFRKVPRHMQVLKQIVGNGLLISEGDLWLRQRRRSARTRWKSSFTSRGLLRKNIPAYPPKETSPPSSIGGRKLSLKQR